MEGRLPFGAFSAANWIALAASQHFARYGTTREQLGAIALNARRNAALNPSAVYQEPLSLDQYLDARLVSTPFGLYDCDVPCDGAVALVLSARDAARDLPSHPSSSMPSAPEVADRISWIRNSDPRTAGVRSGPTFVDPNVAYPGRRGRSGAHTTDSPSTV